MLWLCGKELPARASGYPHLYCQAKENDSALAVVYMNFYPDEIRNAEIKLGQDLKNVRFIGCKGRQTDARTLVIESIKAYGFAAFEGELIITNQ